MLLTSQQAASLLGPSRSFTLVVANGCFDGLHSGHKHLLREARQMGDVLCVLLNSDASVRLLKGDDRPINNQDKRAASLFAFADYVTVFEEETPIRILSRICPDVLVKGAEYKGTSIPGSQYAGRVHLVGMLDGHSTTKYSA